MGKNNCGLKPVDTRKNDVNRVEYYLRFVVTVQFSSTRTFNATSFDHRPMFLYHCSYCTLSPLDVIWCGFFCMMCRDVRIKEIVDELCIWLDQLGTILGGNLPGFWQEQTATAFNFYLFIYSSTELTLSQYIWFWLMSPKTTRSLVKKTNFLATQKKQFSVHRNLSSFILKKKDKYDFVILPGRWQNNWRFKNKTENFRTARWKTWELWKTS